MAAGADPNIADRETKNTPLIIGKSQLKKLKNQYYNQNIKFKIKASCKGDSKKVHVLLEFKANTDDKNNIKR